MSLGQLINDCMASDDVLMPLDEALAMMQDRLDVVCQTTRLPLRQCLGKVLSEHIVSSVNIPQHNNSAVDGYAVRFEDLSTDGSTNLEIRHRVAAGEYLMETPPAGSAVRIFTGAPMPDGFETVFMQEDCRVDGTHVSLPPGIKQGANSRKMGEDVTVGQVVLTRGHQLRPQDIGMLAALGFADVPVFRPLKVAVFSTGDEITDPGQPLKLGGIYDTNRFSLMSLLLNMGCEVTDLGILEDSLDSMTAALKAASQDHDVMFTSGGVSVGEEDHVKPAVEANGQLHFWRIALKPGRPMAVGSVGNATFIGLPGNPVAAMVTFLMIAKPMLHRLMGATPSPAPRYLVPAGFSMKKKPGRREFLRVRLETDGAGGQRVEKFETQGSGVMRSMVESAGLVDLEENCPGISRGDLVWFVPFKGLV